MPREAQMPRIDSLRKLTWGSILGCLVFGGPQDGTASLKG